MQQIFQGFTLLLLGLLVPCFCLTQSEHLSVMSFNIRYDNPDDEPNDWASRKPHVANLILKHRPLAVGIQEALFNQKEYLDAQLIGYQSFGVGRDDGQNAGEFSCIYVDTTRVSVLKDGTFWLSSTPGVPSKAWAAALNRICTYVYVKDKSNKSQFHIYNTHFDHQGIEARNKSAELIANTIENNLQVDTDIIILMGDFNDEPYAQSIIRIKQLLNDPLDSESIDFSGPVGTYNGFDNSRSIDERIDYIFYRNVKAVRHSHILDRREGHGFISDHLPVKLSFSL
jgi:endonuclease/exonuclease/phosphatase family metal-dependent hydrolase